MNSILTNDIETNSFMGLITDTQKNTRRKLFGRRIFVNVESNKVLLNLAIATVIIVMGLTVGSISQQKMEFAQYSTQSINVAI